VRVVTSRRGRRREEERSKPASGRGFGNGKRKRERRAGESLGDGYRGPARAPAAAARSGREDRDPITDTMIEY
jgi:hypothetical protein